MMNNGIRYKLIYVETYSASAPILFSYGPNAAKLVN